MDEKKDRPIDLELVQDTVNYLAKCPYGAVRGLIERWKIALEPEIQKPDKE